MSAITQQKVKIFDVQNLIVAGGENLFCSWPWTGGIHNFGNGEIVIAYTEKACAYQEADDVAHGEAESRLVL
jgi:macrodomain Ter protein organizer (MatP/YcbG family)